MRFSSFSTLIVFVLLAIVGIALIPRLSVQLLPSRSYASVTVEARLPGASPEVVELELTSPIESLLSRLSGVQRTSSYSGIGSTSVRVELDKWTDPDKFRFEAASVLRQLYPQLPNGASYPLAYVNRAGGNTQQQPLLGYILHGPGEVNQIAQFAEETFRTAIVPLNGVDRFQVSGMRPERIGIVTDAGFMNAIGLSVNELQQRVSSALQGGDLGLATTEAGRSVLYMDKAVSNPAELEQIPVAQHEGRIFRLADVATVTPVQPTPQSHYRVNGQELASLTIYPAEHVNTIKLAREVRHVLAEVADRLPPGYTLALQYDSSEHISAELDKIYLRTALSAAILLLFVLLITRQVRYLSIVIMALAANVLLSIICYYLFGLEIHLYSLAGITISLGLAIDNVIVIVEDIRHTGRNRIFSAILASTCTALGALSVIFLLEETQRVDLLDFAIAIIINLLVSLPIAYFFIPALLDRYPVAPRRNNVSYRRQRWLVHFGRIYRTQLRLMVRWRWAFALLFILAFGLPLFLLPDKMEQDTDTWWKSAYNATLGSDFYNHTLREPVNRYLGGALYYYLRNRSVGYRPQDADERTQLQVQISMPNGATLEQMDDVTRDFEHFIGQYTDQLDVFTTSVSSPTQANISILFKKDYPAALPYQLKQQLESRAIYSGAADFGVFGVGRGFSNAINMDNFDSAIALRGYNYLQLQALAALVRDSLLQTPRVADVMVSTQRQWGQRLSSQHLVRFHRPEELILNGIDRWNVSNALVRLAENEHRVGTLEEGGQFTDVELRVNHGSPPTVWAIMNQPMHVNDSTMRRLGGMAAVSRVRLAEGIVRENQEYVCYVNYRFIGTYQLNRIVQDRIIAGITPQLPFGYAIESADWGGGWGEDNNTYLWFIPLVLLIIYMICAVLLESFTQPIAVVLMIPFSFIGVFLIFRILNLQFDKGGYAALLMLSGLVTNAALYIINDLNFFAGHSRKSGTPIRQYVRAFNAKAMPVLVTTAAAVLSLLPFMISGEEEGFWFTLSAGTIGGLLFSLLGVYLMLPLCLLPRRKGVMPW